MATTTTYQQYFNYYKELNQQQIYSTVGHGWQGVYFRIYDDLEVFNKVNNNNIKFVFGTEAYWVKDKSEIGDDEVLTLTPREARNLGNLMVAEAMQYANIEMGHHMAILQSEISGQVRKLTRQVGDLMYRDWETDRNSTRLNSSHEIPSRMPSSA